MKRVINNKLFMFLLVSLLCFSLMGVNIIGDTLVDSLTVFEGEDELNDGLVVMKAKTDVTVSSTAVFEARLFGVIPIKTIEADVLKQKKLVPGGNCFGIKIFTQGVIVVGIGDIETENGKVNPARDSGIKVGDIIKKINGKEVNTNEEVADLINNSGGEKLIINITRDNIDMETTITPVKSISDMYKIGLWVRDSTAGIGTMTFVDSQSGTFGGLGHAICDVDTGEKMPLLDGSIVEAEITGVIKGKKGEPGELSGVFESDEEIGKLVNNTNCGIFGYVYNTDKFEETEALDTGKQSEVKIGKAYILSNVGNGTEKYEIEIQKLATGTSVTKNMVIKIVDPKLIDITGGIVQGMSGSPIIQDNKIIGAVTHVLVNDPTKGYGIFIENMLAQIDF